MVDDLAGFAMNWQQDLCCAGDLDNGPDDAAPHGDGGGEDEK